MTAESAAPAHRARPRSPRGSQSGRARSLSSAFGPGVTARSATGERDRKGVSYGVSWSPTQHNGDGLARRAHTIDFLQTRWMVRLAAASAAGAHVATGRTIHATSP